MILAQREVYSALTSLLRTTVESQRLSIENFKAFTFAPTLMRSILDGVSQRLRIHLDDESLPLMTENYLTGRIGIKSLFKVGWRSMFRLAMALLVLGFAAGSCKPRLQGQSAIQDGQTRRLFDFSEGDLSLDSFEKHLVNFNSIDTLLESLPDYLFQLTNHVLMRYSASECKDEVDPQNPRVIAFDRKSRLILAWTKNSSSECGQVIRLMQGTPDVPNSLPYRMATIVLDKNAKHLKIDRDQSSCEACHASVDRVLPIWSASGSATTNPPFTEEWPGAYGGSGGMVYKGTIKGIKLNSFNQYESFLNNNDARYSKILKAHRPWPASGNCVSSNEPFVVNKTKTFQSDCVRNQDGLENLDRMMKTEESVHDREDFIDPDKRTDFNPLTEPGVQQ